MSLREHRNHILKRGVVVFVSSQKFDDIQHSRSPSARLAIRVDSIDCCSQATKGIAFESRQKIFPRSHHDAHMSVDIERAELNLDICVAEVVDVAQQRLNGGWVVVM